MTSTAWDWVGRAGSFLAVWAFVHALGAYGWAVIGGVLLMVLSLYKTKEK